MAFVLGNPKQGRPKYQTFDPTDHHCLQALDPVPDR